MRSPFPYVIGVFVAAVSGNAPAAPVFAVGSGAGVTSNARLYASSNTAAAALDIAPFGSFTGGVRLAAGDVNGDGQVDLIVGAGPGEAPEISIYDGRTGALLDQYLAFSIAFSGGVFVAAGDVDGDGRADVIVGADAGGGPEVKVFSGKDHSVLMDFNAFAPSFTGGVRVAAADVNGDGYADIIVGAGPGGEPQINIYDGHTGALIDTYLAYASTYAGGVYVAAADLDGDGFADVVVGPEAGAGPVVNVFSGKDHSPLASFNAFSASFMGGVRVGAGDVDGDGHNDIIVATGVGSNEVKVLTWPALTPRVDFFPYAADEHGVYVAGPAPDDIVFANGFE